MPKIDMLWQYVKMKIPSSITFQGKYHFFAQFLLEEVAQSLAWLMEIVNIPMMLVFSGADKDLNKVKKFLEDCNMKVVTRLSTCIHNVEENINSVDVEQESLVNDNNSTSSTVCMSGNITIKEEEASPPT